jgi:hypothetical protein
VIECVYFDKMPRGQLWQPGWVFPFGYDLSKRYVTLIKPHRKPLSVVLPLRNDHRWEASHGMKRGTLFCLDSAPTGDPDGHWLVEIAGELVVGEKPPVTVHPSINAVGIYHGWLKDGVLSDDLG